MMEIDSHFNGTSKANRNFTFSQHFSTESKREIEIGRYIARVVYVFIGFYIALIFCQNANVH